MALKDVHVSDIPNLDQVPKNALFASRFSKGIDVEKASLLKTSKFMVIRHRGNGMNLLQSTDPRLKALKENSILSFNAAAKFVVDYVEFDVQFTAHFFNSRKKFKKMWGRINSCSQRHGDYQGD
ncbi:Glycerophosphodiester phosphodiesterase domain [Dillenia turbinata]|uniref:glycerophosphodiester phosphodiesterase n=1 Tax=Dillenia turbinata TaxID=194707 RepID=A0AAN8YZW5_9MAGN